MKDIVYSEAEYAILITRIETYSTFLSNSINKYQEILDFLMEDAIHDELIRAKILKLKSDVSLYTSQLESIRAETKSLIAKMSEDFEDADKMNLPDMEMSFIQALLSAFK
ncbi:MAG: hypothetical protein ACI3W5_17645 [Faecousia sp.]